MYLASMSGSQLRGNATASTPHVTASTPHVTQTLHPPVNFDVTGSNNPRHFVIACDYIYLYLNLYLRLSLLMNSLISLRSTLFWGKNGVIIIIIIFLGTDWSI